MSLLAVFVALPYFAVTMLLGVYFFRRARWKRKWKSKRGKGQVGFYPTSLALGNAFHQLQCFTRPAVEYVLAEKLDDNADDDDSGGPEGDAKSHLTRQLRRIRRGEAVGKLTVRLQDLPIEK